MHKYDKLRERVQHVHERHGTRARTCVSVRHDDCFLCILHDTVIKSLSRVCRRHVGSCALLVVLAQLVLLLEVLDPELHRVPPHARGHCLVERIWLLDHVRIICLRPDMVDLRDSFGRPCFHRAICRPNANRRRWSARAPEESRAGASTAAGARGATSARATWVRLGPLVLRRRSAGSGEGDVRNLREMSTRW